MQPPAEPAETHPAKHQAVQLNKGARGEDEHGDHNGHHQGHWNWEEEKRSEGEV